MPRARRTTPVDRAIELFAEHHIVAVRRRRGGEITKVKHVAWGWISPEAYYGLQKVHDLLPTIEKVVEGGYRLKAALWSIDISFGVLATGSEFPLGMAFVAGALGLAAIDKAAGRPDLAALDVLALALPFGEIYLLARGAVVFTQAVGTVVDAVAKTVTEQIITPITERPVSCLALQVSYQLDRNPATLAFAKAQGCAWAAGL